MKHRRVRDVVAEAAGLRPEDALALAERVKPLLAGAHPGLQGAALAELLSIWLAGHPAVLREELLDLHIAKVRELIPVNAAIIRGEP